VTDLERSRDVVCELLGAQRYAVLATQREGLPHLSLMAFATTTDLKLLIVATERDTRKYGNMIANPRTAVLIDNRSNQGSDAQDAIAVTATGIAEEVDGLERDRLQTIFLARHPHLAVFVGSTSCALFRIKVTAYQIVGGIDQVSMLPMAER
jgi:nitroimidazol reductase NimA-like FMN-containing flavoprotein (pyridoxamine 5'-phosphate oxidase superfamily)